MRTVLAATLLLLAPEHAPLERLERAYSIEVVTAGEPFPVTIAHGAITGADADDDDVESYAPILALEFGLYPRQLVQRTGLERIVLCRDLAFETHRRTAVPDYEHHTLYLDVARGRYSDAYTRQVVHHEFFHIIDYRDDGSVYRDDEWARLNPPDFAYSTEAKNERGAGTLIDTRPGFLTAYSCTGVEEDKAEVFAYMLLDPEEVERRTKTDPVLRAKTERMRKLLATFCPKMNTTFWEKVKKARREPTVK